MAQIGAISMLYPEHRAAICVAFSLHGASSSEMRRFPA